MLSKETRSKVVAALETEQFGTEMTEIVSGEGLEKSLIEAEAKTSITLEGKGLSFKSRVVSKIRWFESSGGLDTLFAIFGVISLVL